MSTSKDNRQKRAATRVLVYGMLFAALWGAYVWQPWEYDLISRRLPQPNPPIDPDSAHLFSGHARVLVVTAHPDDSAFYIGGLLTRLAAAGTEIHQVLCTDGDKGYYPFEDWRENRTVRRKEALEEAAAWGGRDILFLGRPDGRLRNDTALVGSVAEALQRVKPDYLLCFDGEFPPRFSHQDHRRSGDAAWIAAEQTRIPKWVLQFSTIAPNYVVDISREWPHQQKLLEIHRSQFYGKHLQRIINMVGSNAAKDGETGGFTFGEGLRCTQLH
jgi:LmbE family N-acetylglucosaminyl deacetylase